MNLDKVMKGARVEGEHKSAYNAIKREFRNNGRIISFNEFTRLIAKDHLKEDPQYYSKLKKAKL